MSDSRNGDTPLSVQTVGTVQTALSGLAFRSADFETLAEALDYAAEGESGMNFYDRRGAPETTLSYADLRANALKTGARLAGLGLRRGARVAVVAETRPEFVEFFFACQYAGLVPVPIPAALNLGGHRAFIEQTTAMLKLVEATVAVGSEFFAPYLEQCVAQLAKDEQSSSVKFVGTFSEFNTLPPSHYSLTPVDSDEIAYLQFTSGSTRFPRAVMVKSAAVMANLAGIIRHGVHIGPEDRCLSWLPFYHDMGLVGLVLVPVASQINVDYLGTRDFAMRPRLWLDLLHRTKATISFSPPFGYELVAKRLRTDEAKKYDLSAWRVAGVGAEMIRGEILDTFERTVKGSGFDARAFLPCYGMAECSLGVTFSDLDRTFQVDTINRDAHASSGLAEPLGASSHQARSFVECGQALPGYEMEVRGADGNRLADREIGEIFLRGPSVMAGYLNEPEVTWNTLSGDGWLNTGDLGYMIGSRLVVTGRAKDLIIVNGRNVWPQDLEYIAESQEGIRSGDALAFSIPSDAEEFAVIVVQCRERNTQARVQLIERIRSDIARELGIDCLVDLVPAHTLPRTSSGKLSRSRARADYMHSGGLAAARADIQAG
ncbi:MAG: fatty acyl-AMP ligase [Gammaproteobacteria bacterium]|nr:fatty acyl-AMP ligase [Gammaproteobacteria bacterium]MCY4277202.1 fatty acyl-AMP ligase [Gammaproteobacteria bacterium]MCY4322799.1 fatty acyl-AMP ligase [Gammaproteobacteria bacterium]